jgi:hypothetical protein
VLGGQAEEMARLTRWSVVLYEFTERVRWDEDLDAHAASGEHVQLVGLQEGEGMFQCHIKRAESRSRI